MSSRGQARAESNFSSENPPRLPSLSRSSGPTLLKRRLAAPVLITGGAGFIGSNLADKLLSAGQPVIVYDNLSRSGSEINLARLTRKHGSLLQVVEGDIRNYDRLESAVCISDAVFHFAAQVAVTESLTDPRLDFDVNVRGTINVLEAIRATRHRPPLFFTSTNKVYGSLGELSLVKTLEGYRSPVRPDGIDESQPLDFHSPYACSKGAADQYVLDYAHSFDMRTVVFRMSCIYGPHQFGNEDQGWIAHFLIRAKEGKQITIYGDGLQVRDVLFVNDLVNAFCLARRHIAEISGQPFNIGGGPGNLLSLLQLTSLIGELEGRACCVDFSDWRQGDQRYYVSCTKKFESATGWEPKVNVQDGVATLFRWLKQQSKTQKSAVLEMPTSLRRTGAELPSSSVVAPSSIRRM
jgi:CDP-paratose 2-epimerase